MLGFHLPIPLFGELDVECIARKGFSGKILSGISYQGEYHFRVLFIHGIYTPRNWTAHHDTEASAPDGEVPKGP